jgi:hypothetical protein
MELRTIKPLTAATPVTASISPSLSKPDKSLHRVARQHELLKQTTLAERCAALHTALSSGLQKAVKLRS